MFGNRFQWSQILTSYISIFNYSLYILLMQTSLLKMKQSTHVRRELFPNYSTFEIKVRVLWIWRQRIFNKIPTERRCLHMYLCDDNVTTFIHNPWTLFHNFVHANV